MSRAHASPATLLTILAGLSLVVHALSARRLALAPTPPDETQLPTATSSAQITTDQSIKKRLSRLTAPTPAPVSPDDLTGTYVLQSLTTRPDDTSAATSAAAPATPDSDYTLTLRPDGTGDLNLDGETYEFTWDTQQLHLTAQNGDSLKDQADLEPLRLSLAGPQLTLTNAQGTLFFTRP
ncbi:hypothetical protein IJJ12_01080 [bacterium]|nr:hypothetical protein [bacterium]